MSTKKNHYKLPVTAIQPASAANRPPAVDRSTFLVTGNAQQDRIIETYNNADIEMISNEISEYYNRGINILKPEILVSSEFVPIRKSFDDKPGFQIQAGDKRISVNQVFRLIELHHSVQKSMNIASNEFLSGVSGIDISQFYEEAKKEFRTDMFDTSLEKTLDAFHERLESNLAKAYRTSSSDENESQNYANQLLRNKPTVLEAYKDLIEGESEPGEKIPEDQRKEQRFFSYRELITGGSQIQKDTARRILEIIVLEKITKGLFDYFEKIVHLKEIKIPKYHDITRIISSNVSGPHENLGLHARKHFHSLKNNYVDIDDILPSNESEGVANVLEPVAVNIFTGETVEPQATTTGAFKYVDSESLAKKALSVKSLESDNFTTIYSLFQSIMKTLTFNNAGVLPETKIDEKNVKLKNSIVNDPTGVANRFFENIEEFFTQVGMSSFVPGNSRKRKQVYDDHTSAVSPYAAYGDGVMITVYTSRVANEKTMNSNGRFAIPPDSALSTERGVINPVSISSFFQNTTTSTESPLKSFYSKLSFIRPPAGSNMSKLDMSNEILSACIFDTLYTINSRTYTTDSFNNSFTTSQGRTAIDNYIRNIMGDRGLEVVKSAIRPDDSFDLAGDVEYADASGETISTNQIGRLGNALFKNQTVVNTPSLPGSNRGFWSLRKTIPGDKSIPLQAFAEQSFEALDNYITDLQNIINKTYSDVGKLYGIFPGTPATKTGSSSPYDYMNDILNSFVDSLDSGFIDAIPGMPSTFADVEYDSANFTKAFNVLVAIAAANDDRLMSLAFMSHYLRKKGYFENIQDNEPWIKTIRSDAANGIIYRLFGHHLGKSVNAYGLSSTGIENENDNKSDYLYLEDEGDVVWDGQNNNVWLQLKEESYGDAGDSTFLDNDSFNDDVTFLGRQLDSDDFIREDKIGFWASNRLDKLFTKTENATRGGQKNPFVEPCDVLKDIIGDKDPSVQSLVNSDGNKTITKTRQFFYDDVNYNLTDAQGNSAYAGSIMYQNLGDEGGVQQYGEMGNNFANTKARTVGKITLLKAFAETPGKFSENYSLFSSSDLHREFAVYSYLCRLLAECLSVKVTFKSGESSKNCKMYITFSKSQLLAFKDAIKNTTTLMHTAQFSGVEGISKTSAHNEVQKQKSIIMGSKKPLVERINRVKICFAALYGHLNNLHQLKEEIARDLRGSSMSSAARIAVGYYGLSNNRDAGLFSTNAIASVAMKKSLLFQLSSNSMPGFYRNYFDVVQSSNGNLLYSPQNNFSDRQLYQMQLAFSGENFGHAASEKLGRKTILSVGIPPGQLTQLSETARKTNTNPDYFMSPYICIHVFKKDALGGDILYYPKPFIFNSAIVPIENCPSPSLHYATPSPLHETEYLSINSFESLLNNFSMYKYDSRTARLLRATELEELLLSPDDLLYTNQSESGNRNIVLEEMKINHMLDYYARMYMKLTTGLDISESSFPLFDSHKIRGSVDSNMREVYDTYREQLFLKYPSVNVDPVLAREFIRLEKNIASSRFFSLSEKTRNVFASKCFERTFSLIINEADFVVYPYPEGLSQSGGSQLDNMFSSFINSQAFVDSIPSLYDPCPYFNLNGSRQIYGTNSNTKQKLIADLVKSVQFSNLSGINFTGVGGADRTLDTFLSGKYRQFLKHINEVESENVSDVYEFFTVVSVLKRK